MARKRYKIPTYKKFYSVIRYDRLKFRHFLNYRLKRYKCNLKLNQWEILKLCYIRENGVIKMDSDEKSIFRYAVLQKIHELLYEYTDKNSIKDGVMVWDDEKQAEILGTWKLPVKSRVKIHLHLLRLLRQGKNLKEAVDEAIQHE